MAYKYISHTYIASLHVWLGNSSAEMHLAVGECAWLKQDLRRHAEKRHHNQPKTVLLSRQQKSPALSPLVNN